MQSYLSLQDPSTNPEKYTSKYKRDKYNKYMNMKHFYSLFLIVGLFFTNPTVASADVSGLVPCKDSPVFKKRLDGSVKKLSARLQNYEPGSPAYLSLEQQIERTKARFTKYGEKGLMWN